MSAKHTKGPWLPSGQRIVAEPTATIIAELWSPNAHDWDSAELAANQRLMCAAPELLEAARYALGKLEALCRNGSTERGIAEAELHAAIAKATEQQERDQS